MISLAAGTASSLVWACRSKPAGSGGDQPVRIGRSELIGPMGNTNGCAPFVASQIAWTESKRKAAPSGFCDTPRPNGTTKIPRCQENAFRGPSLFSCGQLQPRCRRQRCLEPDFLDGSRSHRVPSTNPCMRARRTRCLGRNHAPARVEVSQSAGSTSFPGIISLDRIKATAYF